MMKKLALSLFKSADEKLRSLGHKSPSTPKSNTYCGPQSLVPDPGPTASRSEPPDVPPPPVPKSISAQSLHLRYNDPPPPHESAPSTLTKSVDRGVDEEAAPPLLPRAVKPEMAERRVSQQNKRDADKAAAKRRTRSEGPHGRRRMRNSMHETSSNSKGNQSLATAPGRHSMYTGNHSDEEVGAINSGSGSAGSDDNVQQWTKNPLLVRRSRKSDRNSKLEYRKSSNGSVENGYSNENRGYSPSRAQKAKFSRMEANRKKRIDMTVTSDEECSPQLRISRLRQRAMMSSKLFEEGSSKNELNIVPPQSSKTVKASNDRLDNDGSRTRLSQYEDVRSSQYIPENRRSKYDENDNENNAFNGQHYRQIPVKQVSEKVKTNQIKLPEFLPVTQGFTIPVQRQPVSEHSKPDNDRRSRDSRDNIRPQIAQTNFVIGDSNAMVAEDNRSKGTRVKVSSESPKLRSFHEVKPSQPVPLKKAVGKIELNPRSENTSSDDSLDELIESNIQYLESEIESGKIKRQSGTFANAAPVTAANVVQRKVIREPMKHTLTIHDEFRSRLQGPVNYSSPALTPQFHVTRINSDKFEQHASQPVITHAHRGVAQTDFRQIGASGSATYSPHMKRRAFEYDEDITKSDTQLNSINPRMTQTQSYFPAQNSIAPYPVLNTQTGNITYVQPEIKQGSSLEVKCLSAPSMEAGMFSDVEYDIEVSERIKKWEKKITPAEMDAKQRGILDTIQEFEMFSDSNTADKSIPDTPVEIRRELRQLLSPTDTSGLGKVSVSLARSTSSISDCKTPEVAPAPMYFEPKVVSSETNLHRIFRVVHEPKSVSVDRSADVTPASSTTSLTTAETYAAPRRRKHGNDQSSKRHTQSHAQSLGNMAHSESELGTNSQQTWPPMAVDSDSGVRKSWRMSRYEEEINELKELVADNFRDLRKKFDSDMSETDTRRESSPVRVMTVTPSEASYQRWDQSNAPVTLNIQTVTPTCLRSPAVVRRTAANDNQDRNTTPPVSPTCPPLTPKFDKKPLTITVGSRATPPTPKVEAKTDARVPPDIWSPSMESGKGLISIERVKARTLQTIPFSEDPVWKEIEGLTSFDKSEESPSKMYFDDIDALLELATQGAEKAMTNTLHTSKSQNVMATSLTPSFPDSDPFNSSDVRHRKLSDSALAMPETERRKVFNPPQIQPLKLNISQVRKSSTSALDEVLEDIRASLQKKPMSPKLMKNVDKTETNSFASASIASPLTKSSKAFIFPKEVKPLKLESNVTTKSPVYDNTQATWQHKPVTSMQQELAKQVAEMPYVDPEYTQLPYIINGNYHLDPDLLSEKLMGTGLVAERTSNSSDFNRTMAQFKSKQDNDSSVARNSFGTSYTSGTAKRDSIDQSVMELRNLAKEVENKIGQIKSRIVSADGGKLDSILLALRKFAPMTEQKYFNVNFTPTYDQDTIKRGKLEDALTELEKIYESLNLEDKHLMDRASREEEIPPSFRAARQERRDRGSTDIARRPNGTTDKTVHRRSQIEEVERQTQNEFEDITKSFQVLLDEVTKQCKSVNRRSSNFSEDEPMLGHNVNTQYSTQPPANVFHHEPPRQQLKHGSQVQRDLHDSYNVAIKELESVATGQPNNFTKPVQSSVYMDLDFMSPNVSLANKKGHVVDSKGRSNGLNVELKSKGKANSRDKKSVSNNFVSMVTEFKPTLATSVKLSRDTSSSSDSDWKRNAARRNSRQSNGKGRFRRKPNLEHRKSMPAIMRTVETQTIETQTDESLFAATKNGVERENESYIDDDDDLRGFPVKRKLSTGIAKMVDLFCSSEDEPVKSGKMKHSHSAPDIVDLCSEQDNTSAIRVDNQFNINSTKGATPRSVKHRHEAKSRFRSLQKGDVNLKKLDVSLSAVATQSAVSSTIAGSQDESVSSPLSKPPVYPVWQYPGQTDSPSSKKAEKKTYFGGDFQTNVSDTETERLIRSSGSKGDSDKGRRRTRSDGGEDENERPKSFHELMAAFERDPGRIEKIRMSGLRKCASEESMFIDLVLQRMYPSAASRESSPSRRSSVVRTPCDATGHS